MDIFSSEFLLVKIPILNCRFHILVVYDIVQQSATLGHYASHDLWLFLHYYAKHRHGHERA
jgi:hypothetical protein